jgi:hypothetical protein
MGRVFRVLLFLIEDGMKLRKIGPHSQQDVALFVDVGFVDFGQQKLLTLCQIFKLLCLVQFFAHRVFA